MLSRNQKDRWQMISLVALLIAIAVMGSAVTASAERWTSLNGESSIEAELIGLWEDTVILQRSDGRRITVKLDSLRGDSRIQARNMAEEIAVTRDERIRKLKQRIASGKAPAPEKIPEPPPAPQYTPPQKDLSIGDFVQHVNKALAGGHLRVLYDFRPPGYRKDISDVIKLSANKTSPATWQAVVGMPHRLGDLIIHRQNWLFSSPRFKNFAAEDRTKAKWTLLGLANVLYHGLDPSTMKLETFQTVDFETWLDSWDTTVAPYVAEMIEKSGVNLASQTTIVSEGEGTAVISTGQGDSPVEVTLVLVEGFWVPKTTAESWENDIKQAKKKIADTADGEYMATEAAVAGVVGAAFESLSAAESADQYYQALDVMLSQADSAKMFQQAFDAMLSPIQTLIPTTASPPKTKTDSPSSNSLQQLNLGSLRGNDDK